MENNENYSCVDCIWHDQCESDVPCDFFDIGQSELLTDGEVEKIIESGRKEFKNEFAEYVGEFSDGNVCSFDMKESEFDEKEME